MELLEAERILCDLPDDHQFPAMVIDRVLILVEREHGGRAVNKLIDAASLTRRFGTRKVWPDGQ